mmetsp:Transcript_1823/g.3446  ORF Transcript_1823/g.3446 Transcript_1823/m.3446 type:complete len:96 (-) Transcript_1823:814-1101(-)
MSMAETKSSENKLRGKTAVITGASSGIGYATALELAGHGVNVVVAARRIEKLDGLVIYTYPLPHPCLNFCFSSSWSTIWTTPSPSSHSVIVIIGR